MKPNDAPIAPSALKPVVPAAAVAPPPGQLPPPFAALAPNEPAGKLAHKLLQEQINYLNLWAKNNRKEAKREAFWFWALKIPVIVASAGYGLMLNLGLSWQLAVAGAVSAACVLIDGLYRPGNLRNFHLRAQFELRTLADDLSDQWKTALLRSDSDLDNVAALLIEDARKRKAIISGYLSEAEATLGKDAVSPKPQP